MGRGKVNGIKGFKYVVTEKNLPMGSEHVNTQYIIILSNIYICFTIELYTGKFLDFIKQCHHN